jgi:hypothetical protein
MTRRASSDKTAHSRQHVGGSFRRYDPGLNASSFLQQPTDNPRFRFLHGLENISGLIVGVRFRMLVLCGVSAFFLCHDFSFHKTQ